MWVGCLIQRASGTTVSVPRSSPGCDAEPSPELVERQGRPVGLDLGVDDLAATRVPVRVDARDRRARLADRELAGDIERDRLPREHVGHQVAAGPAVGRLDRPLELRRRSGPRAPRTAPRPRAPPRGTRAHRGTCGRWYGTPSPCGPRILSAMDPSPVGSPAIDLPLCRDGQVRHVGVVFVHGIGSQEQGEILRDWGGAIARVLIDFRVAAGANGDPVLATQLDPTAPGRMFVELQLPETTDADGRTSPEEHWLLTEAWWAHEITPPTFGQMAQWLGPEGAIPRIVKTIIPHAGGGSDPRALPSSPEPDGVPLPEPVDRAAGRAARSGTRRSSAARGHGLAPGADDQDAGLARAGRRVGVPPGLLGPAAPPVRRPPLDRDRSSPSGRSRTAR